ncbi:MAG: response regulator transcription factor [Bryobacteraceae bacterium]|nr:response regulator transcription factor [Bryobacteraceae bacterium]
MIGIAAPEPVLSTHRILLVDDHVAIREGLSLMLSAAFPGSRFGAAANAAQALQQVASEHWDLAILDLNLPGRSGLELIRELKDAAPQMGVLVYTVHPGEQFGLRALRAGADGYVTKDQPACDVIEAIRRIRDGRRYIGPALADSLAAFLASGAAASSPDLLSDRELQILQALASGQTPTSIAASLHLSIKTVSTYRSRILEKLQLHSTADIVRYAIQHQLVD